MRSFSLAPVLCAFYLCICAACSAQTQTVEAPAPASHADAACARCHQQIYQRYMQTPMARGSGAAMGHLIPGTFHNTFTSVNYGITSRSGQAWLTYSRPGQDGLSGTRQLLYFLGSGNLGSTYLYSINGYLLESPVAYYSQLGLYDMAPGLEKARTVPGALPINRHCLRCHMSGIQDAEPGTDNRFRGVPFLQGGVTCERCHGDTAQHVATAGRTPVINPIALAPAARDSVCISCHLEGDASVERKGRSIFDYKPGASIGDDISYFIFADGMHGRSVSETEQLAMSHCKRSSGDRMSCMSCHDPHGDPGPASRVAFYRGKCLACHSQPQFATAHFPATPDCTQCHMPKSGARDTPHVAWTDHRILANPQAAGSAASTGARNPAAPALKPFLDGPVAPRDLGLAYYALVKKGDASYAPRAIKLLAQALNSDPADSAVLVALGFLNRTVGRPNSAKIFYSEALQIDPLNMEATNDLATLLARSGQMPGARDLWQSAFAHNEDIEAIGINLSLADCLSGDEAGSARVLARVLLYSPGSAVAKERLQQLGSGSMPCQRPAAAPGAAQHAP